MGNNVLLGCTDTCGGPVVFGSALSNATLRYKTVPGYSWLAFLLLKEHRERLPKYAQRGGQVTIKR